MSTSPEEIIHKLKPTLHQSDIVTSSARHLERLDGTNHSGNAEQKIGAFIGRIEKLEGEEKTKERLIKHLANSLVMSEEDIPEAYWDQQQKLARDNGKVLYLDENYKGAAAEALQEAQYTSAKSWLGYLEQIGDQYPTWFKIYAIEGMSKLGTFNKTTGVYSKRNKGTVAPFPQLDPAALAKTFDAVSKVYGTKLQLDDESLHKLVSGGNFNKIYSNFLLETKSIIPTPERTEDVHGEWREYNESNVQELVEAAQGTPWCIAGEETAIDYTQRSLDVFYLFHLKDPNSDTISPTAAASIRTGYSGLVSEVSGLKGGSNQYLEDSLVPVVMEKVLTLPGGESYFIAFEDKQRLIDMDRKFQNGGDFTIEELRFLYELDRDIEYLDTYNDDPRTKDFKLMRERHKEQFAGVYGELNAQWMVLYPHEIASQIDTLLKAGADIDLHRLVDRLSPLDIEDHFDTFIRIKDTFDINKVIEKIDPTFLRQPETIEKLVQAGANMQIIADHLEPLAVIHHLELLTKAGVTIDIDKIVEKLDNNDTLRYYDKLLAAGASIDKMLANIKLFYIGEEFLDRLIEDGATIDVNAIAERLKPFDRGYHLPTLDMIAARTGQKLDIKDIPDKGIMYYDPSVVLRFQELLLKAGVSQAAIDEQLRREF